MLQIFEKQDEKYAEFPVNIFRFPGGEPHVQLSSVPAICHILARLNTPHDVMDLLVLTDAIKRCHQQLEQSTAIHLTCFCIPGSRQDRVSNIGEAFTLKVYTDIINAQKYNSVTVADAHSEVLLALLDNVKVYEVDWVIADIIQQNAINVVCIPDAGSLKKTFSYYFPDLEAAKRIRFVQCLKKRNTVTGRVDGFKITEDIPANSNVAIFDDIIDGGASFVGLANEIKQNYKVNKLILYGTHGIFSKGMDPLRVFDKVYTTDSLYTKEQYESKFKKLSRYEADQPVVYELLK